MPLTIKTERIHAPVRHTREQSIVLYRFDECTSVKDKEATEAIGHRGGFDVCGHGTNSRLPGESPRYNPGELRL